MLRGGLVAAVLEASVSGLVAGHGMATADHLLAFGGTRSLAPATDVPPPALPQILLPWMCAHWVSALGQARCDAVRADAWCLMPLRPPEESDSS